ncbi:MAG: winged helix-turn-helix domain-containing protein [Polyangia bacterium]
MQGLSDRKALLVEDDAKLAELMRDYLRSTLGLTVEIEPRGDDAVERIVRERPDLVVLDIMLPGKSGLEVCREVRPRYDGPILMLTALGDEVDEVVGLEIGADDYVAKPASPRLLAARVKTLLRRFRRGGEWGDPVFGSRIEIGPLAIDSAERGAWIDGEVLELTTAEFDLLWFLAERAGEVVSREVLYRELRGIEWDGLDRSIDLRVARLRRKIGDDGQRPDLIKSVRGTGYQLAVSQ